MACEKQPEKYYLYVHGFFLPWLEKQRADGRLKQVELEKFKPGQNAFINCDDTREHRFKGEMYKKNEIRGYGLST